MTKSTKAITDNRVVTTSLLVSLSDVSLNFIVGLITGSTVMFSQALQGLSDLVTAGVVFTGVRRSKRAADKQHPLGYGREIFFWVLVAGIFMFFGTGLTSVFLGYSQFIDPKPVDNVLLALTMLSFGLVTNFYSFSQSLQRLKVINPQMNLFQKLFHSSLVETKATLLVDFMGTLAAIFGLLALIILAVTGNPVFDGLGAIAVGIAMMLASLVLIGDIRGLIVGKAVGNQRLDQIRSSAEDIDGVLKVLDLRAMYLGSAKLLVLIEVHIQDGLDTDRIESIIDEVKACVQRDSPNVYHVQVEVETPEEEFTQR